MDLLSDLNEPQREAVTHVDGPLLVLAGAGSGKTRVITRRVAYLIDQGVPPWQVLAITFTNKAAGEMRERVISLGTPHGATVSTFHALCARLLREFAEPAGLPRNFTIYDRNDQLKMVKEAMKNLDLPTDRLPPAKMHAAISNAKNDLRTADAFAREVSDYFGKHAAQVYRQYEKLLAANNALDFDDLLLRVVFLMRDRSDIRELLARRYRYILIDEYQDTNHAQYLLAHGIAMEHENICATGDPDQSIYAWRGADIGNIMEFEQDYPSAKVVRLEENYRSVAPILASASRLIARNTRRKEKTLWTQRQGGARVRLLKCENEHTEAREVARRIADYKAGGGEYGDVAVFYRVNALSRVLEKALREQVIPYAIARGVEFYNRKEIKDLLAYLRLMANQADDLSCERIINVPARGIGATTVGKLQTLASARGANLLDACGLAAEASLSGATAKKVQAFAELIRSLAGATGAVRDIVEEVIRRSGMEQAFSGKDEDDRQARSNLAELVSTAAEFDTEFGGTLAEYLQQVSLVSDVDHLEGAGGTVTLMTLHAAKGLEFPVVFMVGCEQGLLPFVRGEESANGWSVVGAPVEGLEEERRLCFVGMTRAMNELTMSCVHQRMLRGQTTSQAPSQFLTEIGDEDTRTEDLSLPTGAEAKMSSRHRGGYYTDVAEREAIEAMEERRRGFGRGAFGSPHGRARRFGEEDDFPDDSPLPSEYEHINTGSRVHHPMFGNGTVVSIDRQPWPNTRVIVAFDMVGVKKLVLAAAKLELR
jgi:DNA helicase-2/ATP-dependent DNA helicase PcrA